MPRESFKSCSSSFDWSRPLQVKDATKMFCIWCKWHYFDRTWSNHVVIGPKCQRVLPQHIFNMYFFKMCLFCLSLIMSLHFLHWNQAPQLDIRPRFTAAYCSTETIFHSQGQRAKCLWTQISKMSLDGLQHQQSRMHQNAKANGQNTNPAARSCMKSQTVV